MCDQAREECRKHNGETGRGYRKCTRGRKVRRKHASAKDLAGKVMEDRSKKDVKGIVKVRVKREWVLKLC